MSTSQNEIKDIYSFFDKQVDPTSFSAVKISLASPEKIRSCNHETRFTDASRSFRRES